MTEDKAVLIRKNLAQAVFTKEHWLLKSHPRFSVWPDWNA